MLLYTTSRNAEQTNIYRAEWLGHLTAMCVYVCIQEAGGAGGGVSLLLASL